MYGAIWLHAWAICSLCLHCAYCIYYLVKEGWYCKINLPIQSIVNLANPLGLKHRKLCKKIARLKNLKLLGECTNYMHVHSIRHAAHTIGYLKTNMVAVYMVLKGTGLSMKYVTHFLAFLDPLPPIGHNVSQ